MEMVARSRAERWMEVPTDRSKKPKRSKVGKGADPPKVKLEEGPDVAEGEGAPAEGRRKTAVAVPQKEPVVAKAACLGTRAEPDDSSSEDSSSSGGSDRSVTPSSVRKKKPCHREPTPSLVER